MPFAEAVSLLEYWQDAPPGNEMLQVLASAFTTWKPGGPRATTPQQIAVAVEEMGGVSLPIDALPPWMLAGLNSLKEPN